VYAKSETADQKPAIFDFARKPMRELSLVWIL